MPVGRAHETALSCLFGQSAGRTFAEEYWPNRCFSAHGALARLPEILRGPELGSLDALARRYSGPVAFGRAPDTRTISANAHAGNLFKLGFTVYLYDIAAALPGAAAWLAALERELGVVPGCTKIGASASPRGDGLPCHFDGEDVISVQLSGCKTFEVARMEEIPHPVGRQFGPGMLPSDELYPQAGGGFPSPDGLTFQRIGMEPGSALFMPRGTWHRSRADTDSFSISIGIRAPPAMDVLLRQLHSVLLQDPRWRRPLYGVAHADARREVALQRLDHLLEALPGMLARLSAADFVPPSLPGGGTLSESSRLQRVPMSVVRFTREERRLRLTVTAWDHDWIERVTLRTEVPEHLESALGWLAAEDSAFGVSDLTRLFPSVPRDDLSQLLELLRKSGYLRQLWFPVLTGGPALQSDTPARSRPDRERGSAPVV